MFRNWRLLALMIILGALALPALAEPYNYAEAWQQWPRAVRVAYLEGLRDGTDRAYWALTEFFSFTFITQKDEAAQKIWATKDFRDEVSKVKYEFKPLTLEPVLSDLYADPANAFIPFAHAAALATHKLRGIDITNEILGERKIALQIDQLSTGH